MSGDRISLKELREFLAPNGEGIYRRILLTDALALVEAVEAARNFDVPCDCEEGDRCDTRHLLHNALARFKDYEGEQT